MTVARICDTARRQPGRSWRWWKSNSYRKGVDRRRQRGRLLGVKDGTVVRHPIWQLDCDLGGTRPGSTVLAALREVAAKPEAADAVMTAPRSDLDSGSLAGLLAEGDVELVIRLIAWPERRTVVAF